MSLIPTDPIAEIRTRLAKYPGVRCVETSTSIQVLPADDTGFPVSFHRTEAGYTVYYAGWHEEFAEAHPALNCFAFGLSDECRLRVVYRGSTATKWILESQVDGVWTPDSETGLLLIPFWSRRSERLLQNHLIRREA